MKSYTWRDAIIRSHLEAETRHVLHVLACHINDAGESCYPGTWLIARETGYSENTVCKHLEIAEKAGWLIIRKHGYGDRRWLRNEYYPRTPDDFEPRNYKVEKADEDDRKAEQRRIRRAAAAENVTSVGAVTNPPTNTTDTPEIVTAAGEVTKTKVVTEGIAVTNPGVSPQSEVHVTAIDGDMSPQQLQSNYSVELSKEPPNPHSPPSEGGEGESVVAEEVSWFDQFWSLWPSTGRKVAKAKCAEKWRARKLDEIGLQIVSHVAAMKQTDQWKRGYEPAPLTYINQSRWEDPIPQDAVAAPKKFDPSSYVANRHRGGRNAADIIDV